MNNEITTTAGATCARLAIMQEHLMALLSVAVNDPAIPRTVSDMIADTLDEISTVRTKLFPSQSAP